MSLIPSLAADFGGWLARLYDPAPSLPYTAAPRTPTPEELASQDPDAVITAIVNQQMADTIKASRGIVNTTFSSRIQGGLYQAGEAAKAAILPAGLIVALVAAAGAGLLIVTRR